MTYSVYVHVPWCRIRCPYCAFYVLPDRDAPQRAYIDALGAEWSERALIFAPDGAPASTLYVGGGTPSRLAPELLAAITALIPTTDDAERTIEANPEDVDAGWAEAALTAGFNRVSLGVQTLQPSVAKRIARVASQRATMTAVETLRAAGLTNLSLDLMFALPGQTIDDLRRDLSLLGEIAPPHVSIYGLTWEEGTGFGRALAAGRMREAADPEWRDQHDLINAMLKGSGYTRYEVSNFSKPGFQSRHNQGYWTDRPYAGLGPSAHGYEPNGTRWENVRDLGAWIADPVGTASVERPSDAQRASDMVIAGLRAMVGLQRAVLAARTRFDIDERRLAVFVEKGLIVIDSATIRLTAAGVPLADAITARVTDALVRVAERSGNKPPV